MTDALNRRRVGRSGALDGADQYTARRNARTSFVTSAGGCSSETAPPPAKPCRVRDAGQPTGPRAQRLSTPCCASGAEGPRATALNSARILRACYAAGAR